MKRRKNSLRLSDYDYSQPGAYFITLSAQHRLHLFGHICDGKMILNEFGKIVEEVWINLPNHYPNMECGEFVVMPNHVHGVVILKPIDHTKGGFENPENAKEGRFQTCPLEFGTIENKQFFDQDIFYQLCIAIDLISQIK